MELPSRSSAMASPRSPPNASWLIPFFDDFFFDFSLFNFFFFFTLLHGSDWMTAISNTVSWPYFGYFSSLSIFTLVFPVPCDWIICQSTSIKKSWSSESFFSFSFLAINSKGRRYRSIERPASRNSIGFWLHPLPRSCVVATWKTEWVVVSIPANGPVER